MGRITRSRCFPARYTRNPEKLVTEKLVTNFSGAGGRGGLCALIPGLVDSNHLIRESRTILRVGKRLNRTRRNDRLLLITAIHEVGRDIALLVAIPPEKDRAKSRRHNC